MIAISIALTIFEVLAFIAFMKYLEVKYPPKPEYPTDSVEEIRAEINRIKLALNIRTFTPGGEKK